MTVVDAHIHLWDLSRFPLSWFREDLGLPPVASVWAFRDAAIRTPLVEPAAPPPPLVAPSPPVVERARNERDETSQAALVTSPASDPSRTTAAVGIVVQAGDTAAEMRWLVDLVATEPVVRAVVLQYVPGGDGWAGLATHVLNDSVRGIRLAIPGGAADLSDVPGLDALCAGAGASGRVIELLVRPAQLDAVADLVRRHPVTSFVLCHLGLGAGARSPEWEESLRRVAARPNAAAKFSGLATAPGDGARLAALAATAFDAFGGERLMFGSDWPMSARIEPHAQLVDDVARAWGSRADGFWGAVATELYGVTASDSRSGRDRRASPPTTP